MTRPSCIALMWIPAGRPGAPAPWSLPLLGEPAFVHALRAVAGSQVTESVYVVTDDAGVAEEAASRGARPIFRSSRHVDPSHPAWDPEGAMDGLSDVVLADAGLEAPEGLPWSAKLRLGAELVLTVGPGRALLASGTVQAMYRRILESPELETVFAAVREDPPLYLVTGEDIWPVLHQPGTDRQRSPVIWRLLPDVKIEAWGRKVGGSWKPAVVEATTAEALDLRAERERPLLETVLAGRRAAALEEAAA